MKRIGQCFILAVFCSGLASPAFSLNQVESMGSEAWDLNLPSLRSLHSRPPAPQDCEASVRLRSNGTELLLDVEVTDDRLIIGDDPVHSDHVEVWLALPGDFSPYLLTAGNEVAVNVAAPQSRPDPLDFKKPEGGFESVAELRNKPVSVSRQFLGVVHLGFFPGAKEPVQYDREYYRWIERDLGGMDGLARHAGCVFTAEKSGYSLAVRISPAALGFAPLPRLKKLMVMVDVIDTDEAGGGKERILSSSLCRRWADPRTFAEIGLKIPLHTNITPYSDEVFDAVCGNPMDWQDNGCCDREMDQGLSLFSSIAGPVICRRLKERFITETGGGHPTLSDYRSLSLKRQEIEVTRKELDGRSYQQVHIGGTLYFIFQDATFSSELPWDFESTMGEYYAHALHSPFLLPDERIGILTHKCQMYSTFGMGASGGATMESFQLLAIGGGKAEEKLRFDFDGYNGILKESLTGRNYNYSTMLYSPHQPEELAWRPSDSTLRIAFVEKGREKRGKTFLIYSYSPKGEVFLLAVKRESDNRKQAASR